MPHLRELGIRQLDGKVAVVTGAGSGIGRAVAQALGQAGAKVVAFDLDASAASATVADILAGAGEAAEVVGDVRIEADAEAAFREAQRRYGGVDLLACVAGVTRAGRIPEMDVQTWDLIMDINVKGAYLFAKHAIPAMRARDGGAIVNVASVLAFAGRENVAAYCASKAAIVALTRAMALDHASDRIRVNCVAPGSVRTPMLLRNAEARDPDHIQELLDDAARHHPLGRLVEPDEVASLVLFLLSDNASAITGSCHLVDNGLLAQIAL